MKNVSELTGTELDYWVSRASGYRFWLEQRGEYRLAVRQSPGEPEPWRSSRTGSPDRYTEAHSFAEIQCGFFGVGVPRFSVEWADGGPLIERDRISIYASIDEGKLLHWTAVVETMQTSRRGWIGPTSLVAAMRAYVASKYGETVPAEVLEPAP